MATLKGAAVVAGVVVVAGSGGYGLISFLNRDMPDYFSLSASTFSNKYLENSHDYFVDATKNEGWWAWVYKNRYQKDLEKNSSYKPTAAFSGLTSGYGEDGKSIKKVCAQVYLEEKSSTKVKATGATGEEYLESDVWRYCSPVYKKPKTVSEVKDLGESKNTEEKTNYSTSNAYGQAHADKLISVEAQDSDFFWVEQERLFFKDSGVRSGQGKSVSSIFKTLYENEKGGKRKKTETLKSVCKTAYNTSTSDSNLQEADVFKFCSLKGSK
ncbi:hypothetical protein MHSWG343_08090 [Candidatus Mycoplasma haematohominis]|uniref:Uncharacterized protein n=1 Tax=Candidatus Mycoplasma haematohominis TaxID=1494318 RepID=A0A478FQY0_9MOLU|nr:hypothetical protein MHSWG343_08090 [Candidatus Mycoplasma haemohominis]